MSRSHSSAERAVAPSPSWRDEPLDQRPGFLIRRLQQIHSALFAEAVGGYRLTPIMYSVLSALAHHGGPVDQTTLAAAVAIDKTNMADILERLERRALVTRSVSAVDRRVRLTTLTPGGETILSRLDADVARAHARTVEALDPAEQKLFVAFMRRIVAHAGTAAPPP